MGNPESASKHGEPCVVIAIQPGLRTVCVVIAMQSRPSAMAHNETPLDSKKIDLSREILTFLKDGEGKLEIGEFKEAALILGFTGSGKSTLSQFLTGNDDGLMAEEIGNDTGEFTITDKTNRVCKDTIDSCTTLPTLYVDQETKSGFYDCPGFGDTRNVKHDISVTYFIKKVVDSVDAVKLVFVVNYPSVRRGVDRHNLMLLMKNVINMVKDVEKFKDGIALVVTKVDNQYAVKKGQAVMVTDEAIIANIAAFLTGVKETLSAKSDGDIAFYTNAIKFIDILLQKNGDEYPKIGLFRRPDETGKLKESALLKTGKQRLDKIVRSIRYIPKTAGDFGYTLSAESLNHMHALMFNIGEDLAASFQSLVDPLQEHYRSREKVTLDVEELSKTFTVAHDRLSKLKDTRSYSSPITLMTEIAALAKTENVQLPENTMQNIIHYDDFLQFVKTLSGQTATPLQWLQGLNEIVENLLVSRNWLEMLVNLKNALYKYDVLNEVKRDTTVAENLRKKIYYAESGSKDGLSAGLQAFIQQVFKGDFEREYGKIRNSGNVSGDEWRLLSVFLDFSLQTSCGALEASLTGHYVKLSDLKGIGCKNKRRIHVVALRKVFIDDDYIKIGGEAELTIVAPVWEVIGTPKIILDGARGEDCSPSKAYDGQSWRLHGSNGRDGEAGGAGGFFGGFGENCINCQHLTISANGGRGGDGQSGGDGAAGQDFYHSYDGDQEGMLVTLVYNRSTKDRIRKGQKGGNGGDGGNGGRGGPRGTVRFVMYDGPNPKISAVDGRGGSGGVGGSGGRGGSSDRIITHDRSILIIPWTRSQVEYLPPGPYGSWGASGVTPVSPSKSPRYYPISAIPLKGYSTLLNIFGGPTDTTSRHFMDNLEKTITESKQKKRRSIPTDSSANDRNHHKTVNPSPPFTPNPPIIPHKIQTPGIQSYIPRITGQRQSLQLNSISDVQSNLLLLNYIVRMNGRVKSYWRRNDNLNGDDHAHDMAYSAYSPQNIQPENVM